MDIFIAVVIIPPSVTSAHCVPCLRRNIVEIILSIAALQKGLYTVVAASLLGSILSNLLLVLGEGRDDTSYLCEGVGMVGSILPNLLLVLGEG